MRRKGFTIVELLTVMSIMVVLFSVLVPSLNMVRRYAKKVNQRGQFHQIGMGIEMFRNDFDDEYPDSGRFGITDIAVPYCGAMKLCEAMKGQDGLGFHPDSQFNGSDTIGTVELYPVNPGLPYPAVYANNLRSRVLYLENEKIKTTPISKIYTNTGTFVTDPADPNNGSAIINDVFAKIKDLDGRKTGMPVLYYKADTSKIVHDVGDPTNTQNIYNYLDNTDIIFLSTKTQNSQFPVSHPLVTGETVANDLFYINLTDPKATTIPMPHNADSYILLSAGWDGVYGTTDDVYNF